MTHLSRRWPELVEFHKLVERAAKVAGMASLPVGSEPSRQFATRLLNCYTAGLVEFSLGPPRFVAKVSQKPVASPYAQLRARAGTKVVNMRLESTVLSEPGQLVIQQLDGTHDRASLVALVQAWMDRRRSKEKKSDDTPPTDPGTYVDQLLTGFALGALLVG
jgi:hypothetical protein